jgi:hypothetical protein
MGRKNFIFEITAFFFEITVSAFPATGETKINESEGSGLFIDSRPSQSKVYIDGIERGLTPLTLTDISPGVHALRTTKDRYNDWSELITVPENGRLEVFIELDPSAGTIAVNVTLDGDETDRPFEPRVFLNGVRTEGTEFTAGTGRQTVKVSAFGWEDAQKSVNVVRNEKTVIDFTIKEAVFALGGLRLSRASFNPGGGPQSALTVDFTVNAPGSGRFVVLDKAGKEVFSAMLGKFRQAEQRYVWDGKDAGGVILADGDYTLLIEAECRAVKDILSFTARLDSSLDEKPLSLGSAQPGLFFVQDSQAGTKGSFQIEAGVTGGKPPGETERFGSLPFAAGFCFTPAKHWQFSAALNLRPGKEGGAGFSAAAGAKMEILRQSGFAPGLAATITYGFVEGGFESAFGIKTGLTLNVPLSWRIGRRLSLYLSPGALWTGKNGFPRERLPRFVQSGGILYSFRIVSIALSSQIITAPETGHGDSLEIEDFCPAAFSVELRFSPPASNLSISLRGGAFQDPDGGGGFGGLSMGAFF